MEQGHIFVIRFTYDGEGYFEESIGRAFSYKFLNSCIVCGLGGGREGREAMASSSAVVPVTTEASKHNTDCVYFLASPLTCKKVCGHSLVFLAPPPLPFSLRRLFWFLIMIISVPFGAQILFWFKFFLL